MQSLLYLWLSDKAASGSISDWNRPEFSLSVLKESDIFAFILYSSKCSQM